MCVVSVEKKGVYESVKVLHWEIKKTSLRVCVCKGKLGIIVKNTDTG